MTAIEPRARLTNLANQDRLDQAFAALRAAREEWTIATNAYSQMVLAHGEAGTDPRDDPRFAILKREVEIKTDAETDRLNAHVQLIAGIVERDEFGVGDAFPSPFAGVVVTVASKFVPSHAPELGEVVASVDGIFILNEFHSSPLDDVGDAIPVGDEDSVYYERWARTGLRVRAVAHRVTRKAVDVY